MPEFREVLEAYAVLTGRQRLALSFASFLIPSCAILVRRGCPLARPIPS